MSLFAPFIVQNCKTILAVDPELWGCAILGPKLTHLLQTKSFWKKTLIFFYLPIGSLHYTKYQKKKFLSANFWAQNDPFAQIRIFSENLLINLVSFIQANLSSKIQIRYQSSDEVLTTKEHWNLIGWEPFLAI